MKLHMFFIWLTFALLSIACVGNFETGPLQTDSRTIEFAGAERVDARIMMGAGRLQIQGGADDLMDADFTYNVATWKPEVEYGVRNDVGVLEIQQPRTFTIGIPGTGVRYEWDLRLNDIIPTDLEIELGAGESDLQLGALNLNNLDIETGAGKVVLDLSNGRLNDLDLQIGVGSVL